MIGLLPAGGCTVRVNIISMNAQAPAPAIGSQPGPKRCKNSSPTNDARTWPPMILRGCEKGLPGKPNSSTQVAPNEPRTQGWPEVVAKNPTTASVANAPSPERSMLPIRARPTAPAASPADPTDGEVM